MIRVGIAGASGLAGGELLRVLLGHPGVRVEWLLSKRRDGQPVAIAHPDLEGISTLRFRGTVETDVDVVFLCLAHGESDRVLHELALPRAVRVIDLSQDHRHDSAGGWVYGLPELHREAIAAAGDGARVASPGCFATALQLGLLPAAAHGLLPSAIHSSAVTGSTGAGAALSETLHFSWRAANMQVYKPFTHQHLREVRHSVRTLQAGFDGTHHFIPYRGPFTRGIIASSYFDTRLDEEAARGLYRDWYADHPFVTLVDEQPDLKRVVNTNRCLLHVTVLDGMLLAVSVIDNLLKGAAGQAVQSMNLLFGLDESTGLHFKATAY